MEPTREQLIQAYISAGHSPQDAANMADFDMQNKGAGLFPTNVNGDFAFSYPKTASDPQMLNPRLTNLPQQGEGIPKTKSWEGYTGYPTEFKSAEEYGEWAVTQGKDRQGAMEDWTKMQQDPKFGMENDPKNPANKYKNLLPLFGGPRDLAGRAYGLGQSLGQAPGSKNKGLNVALNAASLAAGTARGVFSGFAGQKMNNYVEEWNRKNLFGTRDQDYKAISQTKSENTLGGGIKEDGGLFRFDDGGGFMNGEDEQEPQHNSVEEGGEDQQMNPQMQQAMGMIAQAIQDGQPPQIIIQALVSKGMPEEQATQLVAMVVEKLQQGGQGEEEDDDNEEEQSPKDNMMKRGGTFKHKVGDYIKFKHKGELKEGKIKRIENGKIFL